MSDDVVKRVATALYQARNGTGQPFMGVTLDWPTYLAEARAAITAMREPTEDMSDILERLRSVDHSSVEDCFLQSPLFEDAANEIERLRKDVRRLKRALSEDAAGVSEARFRAAIAINTAMLKEGAGE